jgi:hypothetical protein
MYILDVLAAQAASVALNVGFGFLVLSYTAGCWGGGGLSTDHATCYSTSFLASPTALCAGVAAWSYCPGGLAY